MKSGETQVPVYLTPEEVADELKVTRRTVYQWLTDGQLKGLRAGRLWRIRPEDVELFLVGRREGEKSEADEHTI